MGKRFLSLVALYLCFLWDQPNSLLFAWALASLLFFYYVELKPSWIRLVKPVLVFFYLALVLVKNQGQLGLDTGTEFLLLLLPLKFLESHPFRYMRLAKERKEAAYKALSNETFGGVAALGGKTLDSFKMLLIVAVLGQILLLHNSDFLFFLCVLMSLFLHLAPWIRFTKGLRQSVLTFFGFFVFSGVVFFLTPRLGNSWHDGRHLKQNTSQGESGFDENLSPGEISNLQLTMEPVMRIFSKHDLSQVYFKALSFDQTDGFNWQKSERTLAHFKELKNQALFALRSVERNTSSEDGPSKLYKQPAVLTGAGAQFIKMHLMPVTEGWIPLPEKPEGVLMKMNVPVLYHDLLGFRHFSNRITEAEVALLSGHDSAYGLNQPLAFQKSNLELTVDERSLFLRAPALNEKIVDLLKKRDIWNNSEGAHFKVARLMKLFKELKLSYSLTPNRLQGEDPLHDFLLISKVGFCEHFASAAAVLLRNLKVPARVVVGYQGADYNPIGDFWLVTQASAHAWVEYYADAKWHLLDPTEYVEPNRLNYSPNLFLNYLQTGNRDLLRTDSVLASLFLFSKTNVNFLMDNFNYLWHEALNQINADFQVELYWFIGGLMRAKTGWLFLLLLLLPLGFLFFRKWIQRPLDPDAFQVELNALLVKSKINPPQYGLMAFLKELEERAKSRAMDLNLAKNYERLRFSRLSSDARRRKRLRLLKKLFIRDLKRALNANQE